MSAGCDDSSWTVIDFALSAAERKKHGKKLITAQQALLRFVHDVDYFKMPGSNFKFIKPIVRLLEDSVRE